MKTRCARGVSRLLFGSVAAEVLRTTELPILMLGPAARHPAAPALKSVLVPLDATQRSARILDVVALLHAALRATATLFHVVQGAPRGRLYAEWAEQFSRRGLSLEGEVRLAFGGKVADRILEAAASPGSDLVAMATHSRSGLQRLLPGSVAEEVVGRAPVPAVLVRSAGSGSA
jgi:nucleotide-binding universal stress UspA family protein